MPPALASHASDPFSGGSASSRPFVYAPPEGRVLNPIGYGTWTQSEAFYYGPLSFLFYEPQPEVEITLDRMHDTEPGLLRITTLHGDGTVSESLTPSSSVPHMQPFVLSAGEDVWGVTVDSKGDRARFSVRDVCVVPEPGGLAMFVTGGALLLALRRRRGEG